MPIMKCQVDGRPGFKYGNRGKCYTYDDDDSSKKAAKLRAMKQGKAMRSGGSYGRNG